VNYLNTAPLVYGIKNSSLGNDIQLLPDYPANLAKALINGDIDIGLVPVAAIPRLHQWWLVGDYCIGAEGAVASVCLFSEVPLDHIKTVLLDYQSRTSVELVKVLIKEHWKLNVELITATDGFQEQIGGTTAAVVIGDRALKQRRLSKYSYDLAEAWKDFTGLPFVFAAWVSNKPLDQQFITAFNEANAFGVAHIDDVIRTVGNHEEFDLKEYFQEYISYHLDEQKRRGLQRFLHFLDPNITLSM
jgi:chorismate dehydratase